MRRELIAYQTTNDDGVAQATLFYSLWMIDDIWLVIYDS
jgi:hypothetical protein